MADDNAVAMQQMLDSFEMTPLTMMSEVAFCPLALLETSKLSGAILELGAWFQFRHQFQRSQSDDDTPVIWSYGVTSWSLDPAVLEANSLSDKTQGCSPKSCWVCFATDEDDRTAEWVRPCRCRGSTKWVHQTCLQRWVDEKQRGNSTARVACPQCNAEYLIVFPKLGPIVYVLDLADRLISKACPFAAAGIMVGSIYWTAVTYGAVTVMQVVGHKEGLDVMERADPLFLLIGLPTIPVMLILGKMIRWEDYVLRLWRKYSNKLQILNSIFPGIGCPVPRIPAEASPLADHVSATRILCGALVFPTIATIVGKLMFSRVNSNLQRTILGGIAFVAIKGAFKVYFKQQQYLRQAHRKILNFPEQEEA
ncbi:E3 ubiquitin-protein ligase MARCH5 [Bagarius yarrelli]|uniref:E3 ubiquitin-protein ligase MARCHF5 n=1 Tax=Bagarius yarrelli TaxID=175774 RepID=A0A556TMN8_BAGYA|nr:E3 ubiquitin-protein ligase MARCH5 [Bagarius yarrelli]